MSEHPRNVVNKESWSSLFKTAWEQGVTPSNIKSGFRSTGIYPFDAGVVPASMLKPSEAFDRTLSHTETPDTTTAVTANTQTDMNTDANTDTDETTDDANNLNASADTDTNAPETNTPINDESLNILLPLFFNTPHTDMTLEHTDIALEHTDIALEHTDMTSEQTSINWNTEIENIFIPPRPDNNTPKQPHKRKLTSHRLLTSDLIIAEKKREVAEKERKQREKENRMRVNAERKRIKEEKMRLSEEKRHNKQKQKSRNNRENVNVGENMCCICLAPHLGDEESFHSTKPFIRPASPYPALYLVL